jgi:hypothetical protein
MLVMEWDGPKDWCAKSVHVSHAVRTGTLLTEKGGVKALHW